MINSDDKKLNVRGSREQGEGAWDRQWGVIWRLSYLGNRAG